MSRNESFYHGTNVAPDEMGDLVKPKAGWENLNSIFAFHDSHGDLHEIVPHDPPDLRDQKMEMLRAFNPGGHEFVMEQVNEGRPAYAARDSDDAWRWAGTKAGRTGTPYVYEVEGSPDLQPDLARPDDWVYSEQGLKVTGVNNTKPPMVNNWSTWNQMMAGQQMQSVRTQPKHADDEHFAPAPEPREGVDELDDLLGMA